MDVKCIVSRLVPASPEGDPAKVYARPLDPRQLRDVDGSHVNGLGELVEVVPDLEGFKVGDSCVVEIEDGEQAEA